MPTITITTSKAGVLTNATSVILSNFAGTAGITRNDTGVVVVADGTAFANPSTGTYTYDFTAPSEYTWYTATVEIVASGSTTHRELVFFVSANAASVIVPSAILFQYIVTTLGQFTAVSAAGVWPLFRASLPDGRNIDDNIGAVYDTIDVVQSKSLTGVLTQRYGIRIRLRARDYDTGYEKLSTLQSSFQGVHQADETIGGVTFRINNISTEGIEFEGTEDSTKQRFLFAMNLFITIREL